MRASVCMVLVGTTWNSIGPSWYGNRAPSRGYAMVGAPPAPGVLSRSAWVTPMPTTVPASVTVTVTELLVTEPAEAVIVNVPGAGDANSPSLTEAIPGGSIEYETWLVTFCIGPVMNDPSAVSCVVAWVVAGYCSVRLVLGGVSKMLARPS